MERISVDIWLKACSFSIVRKQLLNMLMLIAKIVTPTTPPQVHLYAHINIAQILPLNARQWHFVGTMMSKISGNSSLLIVFQKLINNL